MANKVHLGEVCLKPVFILTDLLKCVLFQAGQGDGVEAEAQACPTASSPLLACSFSCSGGSRSIHWPLLLSRVVQGRLTRHRALLEPVMLL